MIEWTSRRFACISCSAGHRASSCTHIKRPLHELKLKGRPKQQCISCRTSRKSGSGQHHRCLCGSEPLKEYQLRYVLKFPLGLELNFTHTNSFDATKIDAIVQEKLPIELCISNSKKDSSIILLVASEIITIKEKIEVVASDNICKCHSGGVCLCSSLPRERKQALSKDGKVGLAEDSESALLKAVEIAARVELTNVLPSKCCSSPVDNSTTQLETGSCCSSTKYLNSNSCCSIEK